VQQPNPHVAMGVNPILQEILTIYRDVMISIDITFVNKVLFFITVSCSIKFGMVEMILNRQVKTVKKCMDKVALLYIKRGFRITAILADNEFEPLCAWYPQLNVCAANEHVPVIKRYIRTVKDRSCSAYRMLPFKYIPRIMLIHLIKNAVFWLNTFPHEDGASQKYLPRYIMIRHQLSFKRHAAIEFGTYVQTHEEHSNDMQQRTMECICLGPTRNRLVYVTDLR
jgi:hypothetical protein